MDDVPRVGVLGFQIGIPAWTHQMGRRGSPMATLVPVHSEEDKEMVADYSGWLLPQWNQALYTRCFRGRAAVAAYGPYGVQSQESG